MLLSRTYSGIGALQDGNMASNVSDRWNRFHGMFHLVVQVRRSADPDGSSGTSVSQVPSGRVVLGTVGLLGAGALVALPVLATVRA
jgi:hypothetical protein